MLGIIGMAATIAIAWFMGNGAISTIFCSAAGTTRASSRLGDGPQWWSVASSCFGAAGLMLLVLAITRVCPQPVGWPRAVVVGVLVILTWRYFLWRATSTLNLATPLQGVFSLGLFFLELLILTSGSIQLLLLLRSRDPPAGGRCSLW